MRFTASVADRSCLDSGISSTGNETLAYDDADTVPSGGGGGFTHAVADFLLVRSKGAIDMVAVVAAATMDVEDAPRLFRRYDHDPRFEYNAAATRMLPAATPATTVNATKAWSYDAPEDRTGEEVGTLVG